MKNVWTIISRVFAMFSNELNVFITAENHILFADLKMKICKYRWKNKLTWAVSKGQSSKTIIKRFWSFSTFIRLRCGGCDILARNKEKFEGFFSKENFVSSLPLLGQVALQKTQLVWKNSRVWKMACQSKKQCLIIDLNTREVSQY